MGSRVEDKGGTAAQNTDPSGSEDFRIEPRLRPFNVIGNALRYLALPLTLLVFFPGAEDDHVKMLGFNRAQVFMGVALFFLTWIAYGYWKHLLKVRRLGGSLVVIDREGIFCKERRRMFRWAEMFSVNATKGYRLLGSSRLSLIYKEPTAEGEEPSYESYTWRLDGTDAAVGPLHWLVCREHRNAKPPEDLYLR